MTLRVGARIGPYEVLSLIGAGGMGEVFRARDLTLKRDVALKVLPQAWAGPAPSAGSGSAPARPDERAARFLREAQALAALNHPHIAQVYGLEEMPPAQEGLPPARVLVMELVEGEDLAWRIARGPIPQDEALAIARQVADALTAAHDAGIIHRDLKPANIKIRNDGTAKVLDFGLAKLTGDAEESHAVAATISAGPDQTHRGVVLGTAAYMAPEQARGRPVDRRADVWAFGVVLFEMLTGRRLFEGETFSDTIADVLRRDVPWRDLPGATSPAVVRLLRQCLQRDPAHRLRDAGDLRLFLDGVGDESATRAAESAPPPRRWRAAAGAGAGALLAGVALGWLAGGDGRSRAAGDPAVVRFAVQPPAGLTEISNVALSPDGRVFVYEGVLAAGRRFFVRRLDQAESQPLEGTEGGRWPFVSPDGRWVGFFRSGKLYKVALSGGDPLALCDAVGGPGAAWGPQGRILFANSWTGAAGLMSVSDQGGEPTVVKVATESPHERGHWWPAFLPDGRHVLLTAFMAGAGLNDNRVAVVDLETGDSRLLFPGARPFWLTSGHILFFHAGRYQVIAFDPDSLQPTGEPEPVLDDALQLDPTGDWPQPVAVAASGTVAYVPGRFVADSRLAWIRPDGAVEPLPFAERPYVSVALSPDERRVVVGSLEGGTMRLRLLDLSRRTEQALELGGMSWGAAWHPSGDRVAFTSVRKGDLDVYETLIDTDQRETALLEGPEDSSAVAWALGGRLVTRDSNPEGGYFLAAHDLSSRDHPARALTASGVFPGAALSFDGRWLAYSADQGGERQVLVKPMAPDGAPGRVVSRGGTQPIFGRTPGTLFYRRGSTLIRLAWRDDQGRFSAGDEQVIGEFAFGSLRGYPGPYDTASDGRVLALLRTREPAPPRVQVVLDWPRTLAGPRPD
jgi:serine/threonine-protein kinase